MALELHPLEQFEIKPLIPLHIGGLFLEFDEPGDLLLAAGAPGRPEIEQNDLAPVLLQANRLSIGIAQGEISRGMARWRE